MDTRQKKERKEKQLKRKEMKKREWKEKHKMIIEDHTGSQSMKNIFEWSCMVLYGFVWASVV